MQTPSLLRLALAAAITVLPPLVSAEDNQPPTAPTSQQLKRVLSFLSSEQANRRAGTYSACRKRGDAFKDDYFELLERAEAYHAKQLERQIDSALGANSPAGTVTDAWKSWKSAADKATPFVLTNHDKDKTKFDEMDRLFAAADSAWQRLLREEKKLAAADGAITRVDAASAALREIHREKAWCRPDEFDAEDELSLTDLEEDLVLGDSVSEVLAARTAIRSMFDALAKAKQKNKDAAWANAPQRQFIELLNARRAALDLQPMALDQALCKAATGHSSEMISMGYFAHISPVEEHRTFGQRARKANFQGSASGECIFAGSPAPASAERAWWYSDGHRLINYSRSPNCIGLGPVGKHWTLMTGRKK